MVWSHELISILTCCVRLLSVEQVARTWWTPTRWGKQRAHENLREVESGRLVHLRRVLARDVRELSKPLVLWCPGQHEPDWNAVSRQLRRRNRVYPKLRAIVFASRLASDVCGTTRATPIKLTQMTHDLNVSEVFLHYWRHGLPISSWVSEDNLPKEFPGEVRPDALVLNAKGGWQRAVEYGGAYSVNRLLALRNCAVEADLEFELW